MHIQGEEKLMHMLSITCICTTCDIILNIRVNMHVSGFIMNIIIMVCVALCMAAVW